MELLAKIEHILNRLLFRLGAVIWRLLPAPLIRSVQWVSLKWNILLNALPGIPALLLERFRKLMVTIKAKVSLDGIKEKFKAVLPKELPTHKLARFKTIVMAPFGILSQWLQGLTIAQSMLLLGFSAASVLAGISMVSSGQRMLNTMDETGRNPASVTIEEITYDRPVYYKQERRQLEFSLRIPVYVAQVNELKSVDIDFNVTLSNRQSRAMLSKKEFQLRDHLLLHLEPSIAAFPLEEEGKEILRVKLQEEVNIFLKAQKIPGEVKELKITYILAN